jgi:nucleotide-binding universal stress UspA family protein
VIYSEKNNVDLIVVGTRGRTGFKKILLGSVAGGVVTYAHCPVLVIK